MSKFALSKLNLNHLDGDVVVITGGALGIGSELVRLCYQHKAHVFFADVLEKEGKALVKELSGASKENRYIQFIKADASNYGDNLRLFDAAYNTCGHVDHAVSAAGIGEKGKIVNADLTLEDVRKDPGTILSPLDINLRGPIFFSRIASVYLRQGRAEDNNDQVPVLVKPKQDASSNGQDNSADDQDDTLADNDDSTAYAETGSKRGGPSASSSPAPGTDTKRPRGRPRKYPKTEKPKRPIGRPRKDHTPTALPPAPQISVHKSLTLVSSVAGFTEAPGLTIYSAAKHGVLGLMRSLRKMLIKHTLTQGCAIRTNAICPWMTKTRMVLGIQEDWDRARLPTNEPEEVARIIAGAMVDRSLNGAALYVAGGEAWDIEVGLEATMEKWMGAKQAREFRIGQTVLGTGEDWQKGKGKERVDDLEKAHERLDAGEHPMKAYEGTYAEWMKEDAKDPAAGA